jgi:hypothetical protein
MKRHKMQVMAATMVVLVGFLTGMARAETGTFTCTVNQAGPSAALVRINLTHSATTPTFTAKWCKARAGQENRMLAVAMAAITNNLKVVAVFDPAATGTPEITTLYLKK